LLHFDQPGKDRETYETTGLDIGCEHAMFQKYICPGSLRFVAYAVDSVTLWARYIVNEQFAKRMRDFQKTVNGPGSRKIFEWRNGK
jgi:hypothetical protein